MIKEFCLSTALAGFSLLATTAAAQPAAAQSARPSGKPLASAPPSSTPRNAATDVIGWNKVTWRMTVVQAKRLFTVEDITEPEGELTQGRYPVRFVVNNIDIGGIPCSASIETDRNTDSIAGVALKPAKDFQELPQLRASAFAKLKELLIQKYGKPKSDDQRQENGDINSQVLWSFPATTIELYRSEGRYDLGYVLLMYHAVDKQAQDVL
jgi:hypothetical protein